ncbi:MAG: hypothetical protein ACREIM_00210 [Nitrospiraceae bacterium]
MKLLTSLVLVATVLLATTAIAQNVTDTNMDILLQKVKADKKLLVASNMGLSEEEGKKFWPLYGEYQKELEHLNHSLGKTIKEYADAFNKGPLSNEQAKKLMDEALAVEDAEAKLKRTYADKIGKVLSAAKTARYIQIENKIRTLLKAELAKEIPLVY